MNSGTGMAAAKSDNVWLDFETLTLMRWLDNDETSYRHWRAVACQLKASASDSEYLCDGHLSHHDAARYELADRLQTSVQGGCPEIGPSMYADLLRAALTEVNWRGIADHVLAGLE